jgi:hypothetical protein
MSGSQRSAPPARRPSSPPTRAAHATRIEQLVAQRSLKSWPIYAMKQPI